MDGMKILATRYLTAAVLAMPACLAHAEGDAAVGKALYTARCAACHSIEYNAVGPTHKNLIGRRAGTAPGFAYSAALKNSSVVWNDETLRRWLADPEKFIPGQKMFVSVPDEQERAHIVAYLLQAGAPQSPTLRKPGE
jgi:cytochrome c